MDNYNKYQFIEPNWNAPEFFEPLRKWLDVNMHQLDFHPTENALDDNETIQRMTDTKFTSSVELVAKMATGENDILNVEPFVVPNIQNVLNERDTRLEPKGFSGKLYPPQATLLQRMLFLEANTTFPYKNMPRKSTLEEATKSGEAYQTEESFLQSNVGFVNERFSFGKTFSVPALIAHQPIPDFRICQKEGMEGHQFGTHYHNPEECLPINLVFCGHKVASEWLKNIKTCTTLTHAKVMLGKDLEKLQKLFEEKKYPDVIIVKDGQITHEGVKKTAIEHFMSLFGKYIFARFFVDDYDMLKIPHDAQLPHAAFTWLISSTSDKKWKTSTEKGTIGNIVKSHFFLNFFWGLKCNADYSSVEFCIPKIEYFSTMEKAESIITKIVHGETPESRPYDGDTKEFLTARGDVPYVHGTHRLKVMVNCEDKVYRRELHARLLELGVKAVMMDLRNIHKFADDDNEVVLCGLLHGVNLGYLSHVVIVSFKLFSPAEVNQIVGRAQRISRKQNLQVYLQETQYDYNDGDSDSDSDEDYPRGPHGIRGGYEELCQDFLHHEEKGEDVHEGLDYSKVRGGYEELRRDFYNEEEWEKRKIQINTTPEKKEE